MRVDLNDYAYFAEVVAHGGFAAAGRALREPKSKLSRRVANGGVHSDHGHSRGFVNSDCRRQLSDLHRKTRAIFLTEFHESISGAAAILIASIRRLSEGFPMLCHE